MLLARPGFEVRHLSSSPLQLHKLHTATSNFCNLWTGEAAT